MAHLGAIAIRTFDGSVHVPRNTATMRALYATRPVFWAFDWQGGELRTMRQSMHLYRTRSSPPQWWGTLPTGGETVLPTYEIRGRVMQRDPVTEEDTPVPLVRVALFYRRLNYVVDVQVSDDDGYVNFQNLMPGDQSYYGIAFDREGAPMQNSVLWDRLTSVPGT